MLLKMLQYGFIVSSILFVMCVIAHKLYFSKTKDSLEITPYVAIMAFSLALYIILGFIYGLLKLNAILILLALSPFIIGKFATYQKEKIYSILQIVCVLISIAFVL